MCCFFLCSPLRSRSVSVMFVFNASLIDVAPVSPISFPIDFDENGKKKVFC